jgi:predicted unusual protein kinase regulating ubiquinone biosynthesis (AarF/ABC1/UbiB family)
VVKVDLSALRVVAGWVHRYRPLRKHVNLPALLEEFTQSLFEEIQYLHEGKNAETFAPPISRIARMCACRQCIGATPPSGC